VKKYLIVFVVAAMFIFGVSPAAYSFNSDKKNIQAALKMYEQALNASDVTGIVKLYSKKGVFMAPHHPSAVGADTIKVAYTGVFNKIDLDIEFDIVEIKVIADNWAFVRTNSNGTIMINATGDKFEKGHQELFLYEKNNNGKWKIARYSFSSTDPLPR